jgi:hypothetical protein
MAAERAELFSRAAALGLTDAEVRGKTTDDIVKAAVIKSLGDEAVRDKDPNYLRGVFDYLSTQASAHHDAGAPYGGAPGPGPDPIARLMRGGVTDNASPEAAWRGMVNRMQDAWKNPPNPNVRQ